jgi:hypothetical protein
MQNTYGTGVAVPTTAATLITGTITSSNQAIDGQLSTAILTNLATQLAGRDATKWTNVALIWAGINDIYQASRTGAQVLATLTSLISGAIALGYEPVVCTLPKVGIGDWTGTMETHRVTVNTGLPAVASSGGAALCDLAALAAFSDPNNTTFYFSDKLHYNSAGKVAAATAIAATIDTMNLSKAPRNLKLPVTDGFSEEGDLVTYTAGLWAHKPTLTRQWRRNGANISGQTGTTFILTSADGGTSIVVRESASNAYDSATADAAAISATNMPTNLLSSPRALNSSPWTGFNLTVTENFGTNWDGASDSNKLLQTNATTPVRQIQPPTQTSATVWDIVVYAKAGDADYCDVALIQPGFAAYAQTVYFFSGANFVDDGTAPGGWTINSKVTRASGNGFRKLTVRFTAAAGQTIPIVWTGPWNVPVSVDNNKFIEVGEVRLHRIS